MINFFKNINIRTKLLASFFLIIVLNASFGFFNLRTMEDLSQLVNTVYDKALMSGTFSQAAKFNFSRFDSTVKSALLSQTEKEFKINKIYSEDAFETLIEDLDVVEERSLGKKPTEKIKAVKTELQEINQIKNKILSKKKAYLETDPKLQKSLALFKDWDKLELKTQLLRKITAIHDHAAELGYLFRIESDKKNKITIRRSLILLTGTIIFSIIISFLMAYLFIVPLFKLRKVCFAIEEGDFGKRSEMQRNDEFGILASAFNKMLNTIQEKTENMRSLLNALPFGLFYFNEKGSISSEYSPATKKVFNNFESFEDLADFFKKHNYSKDQIDQILQAAYGGLLPFNSAMGLFPEELTIEDNDGKKRYVELLFRPNFNQDKQLDKVILLAEDITEKKEAMVERERLFERVKRVAKVSSDTENFKEFMPHTQSIFEDCLLEIKDEPQEVSSDTKRKLHTIKGLLSLYNFEKCATLVHEVETALSHPIDYGMANKRLLEALKLFRDQSNDLFHLLNLKGKEHIIEINQEKLKTIRKTSKNIQDSTLKKLIKELDYHPFSLLMGKYRNYLDEILAKNNDLKAQLIINENSDEISLYELKQIDDVLIHLLNNSVAHGLETKNERLQKGKSPKGTIEISHLKTEGDGHAFHFQDDGSGIDPHIIAKKCLEKGFLSKDQLEEMSDKEVLNLIFLPDFSSKDEADSLSGRGVGLDAVKNQIAEFGGTITVESQKGSGTHFTITLPELRREP